LANCETRVLVSKMASITTQGGTGQESVTYLVCERHVVGLQVGDARGLGVGEDCERKKQQQREYDKKRRAKQTGVIYKITCKRNGKGYIGQTRRFRWRMKEHKRSGRLEKPERRECVILSRAIQKYGWNAFEVTILERSLTKAQLDERETALIAEHDTMNPNGYNYAAGGNADPWRVPEVAARLRAIKKTPEMRVKLQANYQATKEKLHQGHADWMAADGGKRKRDIAAEMRSHKTEASDRKVSETCKAKAIARYAEIAKTNPKEAARLKRKAEMDSARHARNREAKQAKKA
jgi:group I intron endonuclease